MKPKFKIGDMVQSRYRSCWHGEVLDIIKSKTLKNTRQFIYEIKQLYTVDGRPQRKQRIVQLDEHWLKSSSMVKHENNRS